MVRDQGHLPGLTLFVTMTSPIIHTLLLPDVWQNSVRTEKGRKKLGPQLQGKHSFQPLKPTLQYGGGEVLREPSHVKAGFLGLHTKQWFCT